MDTNSQADVLPQAATRSLYQRKELTTTDPGPSYLTGSTLVTFVLLTAARRPQVEVEIVEGYVLYSVLSYYLIVSYILYFAAFCIPLHLTILYLIILHFNIPFTLSYLIPNISCAC